MDRHRLGLAQFFILILSEEEFQPKRSSVHFSLQMLPDMLSSSSSPFSASVVSHLCTQDFQNILPPIEIIAEAKFKYFGNLDCVSPAIYF